MLGVTSDAISAAVSGVTPSFIQDVMLDVIVTVLFVSLIYGVHFY